MIIDILTVIPDFFDGPFRVSMLKRAQDKGLVSLVVHDLRAFTEDKHRQVDDYPYGGGAGMILKPEPIFRGVRSIRAQRKGTSSSKTILMSPQGEKFSQEKATELATFDHIVLICGHYKGVDERVAEFLADEELSVGDYVLTGGEPAALIVVDAVVRLLPGVLGDSASAGSDSFQSGLLDCPYYTRPEIFEGWRVPEVLLSGNHREIARWRARQAFKRTQQRRKDLLIAEKNEV